MKEYLDIREINGYSIHYTPFHPAPTPEQPTPEPIRTLVYIGTPTNDQFTGPQDVQALAAHIHRSVGPSGPNRDYLLSLDEALRGVISSSSSGSGGEDEHITDLSRRVRALIAEHAVRSGVANGRKEEPAKRTSNGAVRGSVDEQEETEKVS